MKLKYIIVSLFVSTVINAECEDFPDKQSAMKHYVETVNKEDTLRRKPLTLEKVNVQEKDVNGDDRLDLLIFDGYHCGASTGCRDDIYLCKTSADDCSKSGYCYSGRLMEAQVVKDGKNLKCN